MMRSRAIICHKEITPMVLQQCSKKDNSHILDGLQNSSIGGHRFEPRLGRNIHSDCAIH